MTAYVMRRKNGISRGLLIDGVELKRTESVVIHHVPDDVPKIVATIVVMPADTFEYQEVDADQG